MPNPSDVEPTGIAYRFEQFLDAFTIPLLPSKERSEVVSIFQGLTEECLADYSSVDQWNSGLGTDGTPIELSLVVSRKGQIDVRFLVDTQHGHQKPEQSRPLLRRRIGLVVPGVQEHGTLIDRLLAAYLDNVPDPSSSYVGLGTRVSPGKPRAGRIYFRNWWRPLEESRDILSQWLHKDDAERLWSSPIGQVAVQGVGYDFNPRGLGRVKVYSWTAQDPKVDCCAVAKRFIPQRAAVVEKLLNAIAYAKHPFWRLPLTLVAVGFRPEGGFTDLAYYFPAPLWEWQSFRQIEPVFVSLLGHWGIPFAPDRCLSTLHCAAWRFVPTWLAVTVSSEVESVSVYFKPTKQREEAASQRQKRCLMGARNRALRASQGDEVTCAGVLESMYRVLLTTEER